MHPMQKLSFAKSDLSLGTADSVYIIDAKRWFHELEKQIFIFVVFETRVLLG